MAINGDDWFWPQAPATPAGDEGVTKREALVFFLAMGFTAKLGEAALHSSEALLLNAETSTKIWTPANQLIAADPTP